MVWTRRPLVHFYRLCWRARSGGMSAASASYRGPPPEFRWPMTRPGRVATFHRANKAGRFVTAHSLKPRQDSAPERGAALQLAFRSQTHCWTRFGVSDFCICLYPDDMIFLCHVGESRKIVFGKNQKAFMLRKFNFSCMWSLLLLLLFIVYNIV